VFTHTIPVYNQIMFAPHAAIASTNAFGSEEKELQSLVQYGLIVVLGAIDRHLVLQ